MSELAKTAAMEQLDDALCNFCNSASDPWEPVDRWRKEVWDEFVVLCAAYNSAYSAGCFPQARFEATVEDRAATLAARETDHE
jgi:hypothetical protein